MASVKFFWSKSRFHKLWAQPYLVASSSWSSGHWWWSAPEPLSATGMSPNEVRKLVDVILYFITCRFLKSWATLTPPFDAPFSGRKSDPRHRPGLPEKPSVASERCTDPPPPRFEAYRYFMHKVINMQNQIKIDKEHRSTALKRIFPINSAWKSPRCLRCFPMDWPFIYGFFPIRPLPEFPAWWTTPHRAMPCLAPWKIIWEKTWENHMEIIWKSYGNHMEIILEIMAL